MVDSRMRTIHHDVAIIGGGLVGTWTAYFLRKRGRSVAVIEKGAVGSQASGVNFGNVRLQGRHPTEFPLAIRAMEQWERFEQLIGVRCEFSQCGHAYFALDQTELPRLERYQREGTAGGLDIKFVDANELRRRFPWLGPDVCAATWSKRGASSPVSARSTRTSAAHARIPARMMARRSCRSSARERVSESAWDRTRPKGRSRRRISSRGSLRAGGRRPVSGGVRAAP